MSAVCHPLHPLLDYTLHTDHPLWTYLFGDTVRLCMAFGIEYHLGQPPAVAEIDKNHPSMVASTVYPAGKDYILSDIL